MTEHHPIVLSANLLPLNATGMIESFISASLRLGNMFQTFPTDYIHVVVCDKEVFSR